MEMKLTYSKIGNYLLPNLTIKNQNYKRINKYGLLKLNYLKENNKALYTTLLMKNELTNYLISVSNECENRLNNLMEQLNKSESLIICNNFNFFLWLSVNLFCANFTLVKLCAMCFIY